MLWKMCCNIGSSYDITGTSLWPLRHSIRSLNVRTLRCHRVNCQLVIRGFSSSGNTGFGSYFSSKPYRIFKKEAIGAEYGEGFESFRPDGTLKVDVEFLNNRLQEGFLQRVRHCMKPDEVYGLIFSWDNVVVDGQALKVRSLRQLASQEGKELPTDADMGNFLLCGSIDEVLRKVFHVDETESKWNKLKVQLSQIYHENLYQLQNPVGGLVEWLDAVATSHIPCAVVSNFDRRMTVEVLEHMGISRYFQAIVSEEDDMESLAHKFLSAAVKLDRKPSKCVVFEDDPRGVTAAHNCTMMAIALIGVHPAYNLGQADITVRKFSELSVINLRRLFSREGFTFMDPQKETILSHPPNTKLAIDAAF